MRLSLSCIKINSFLPSNLLCIVIDPLFVHFYICNFFLCIFYFPCFSLQATATTGALSDRFKIATDCLLPDLNLSPQVLLDCGSELNAAGSCLGGSHLLAYSFIHQYGITDRTCNGYKAADITSWAEIPCADRMCRDCDVEGVCQFVNGTKYYADEFGQIQGEEQMKAEIYARGPIACLLYAHSPEFWAYDGKSIISDPEEYPGITHVVSIQGWGVDESTGEEYWVGRNSFGSRWGALGFFKILRGKNTLNLESNPCVWAVPAASSVEEYKGNFF